MAKHECRFRKLTLADLNSGSFWLWCSAHSRNRAYDPLSIPQYIIYNAEYLIDMFKRGEDPDIIIDGNY